MDPSPHLLQTVAAFYRILLGRESDPPGLAYYANRLREGADLVDIASDIADSGEALSRWDVPVDFADRPLIFLHVMKTGGTSLTRALQRHVPPGRALTDVLLDHLVLIPSYATHRAVFLAGHLPFEATELLNSEAARVIVLRDPLERTLSHYRHLRRLPEVMTEQPDFSLEVFLNSPRWRTLASNYQARHLGHTIGIAGGEPSPAVRFASLGHPFPSQHALPLQSFFDCSPTVRDDVLLERASACLGEIEFVGVTDELDPLYRRLLEYWSLEEPGPPLWENVGSGWPTRDDLPSAMLARILEINQVDLALYEQAKNKLEAR